MTFTDDIPGSSPSRQAASEDQANTDAEKESSDLQWLQHTQLHRQDTAVSFSKLFVDNWLYVITYCGVFGSFGVCVGFLGPTVFDLGCQTNSDLKKMNWVFFVQLIMTLVGSISAGCLVVRLPLHMLMLGGAVGVSLSMFLIPSCTSMSSLICVLVIMGWCMGCLDCLANLRMIQMFGNNVGPFLQAMHCFYAVGAFISPMVASAFLLNQDCTPYIDGFTIESVLHHNGTAMNDTSTKQTTVRTHVSPKPHRVFRYHHMSKLPTAFYILGGLQLVVAGLVFYVILQEKMGKLKLRDASGDSHDPSDTPSHAESSTKHSGVHSIGGCSNDGFWTCGPRDVVMVTFLTCLSLFVFDGLQSSFANYIYTYASESGVPGLYKYEGAVLDACFWGLFAVGRIIAVPVASQISASFMLLINIAGCAVTLLVTIIFRWSHTVIYVGTCSVGLFMSSMSPTVMSMTEQFVDINSSIATCMVVVAALGEAVCPVIVGNLVVTSGPGSFLVFCFTLSITAVLLYVCLTLAGRQTQKFAASGPVSFVRLSRQPISQAGESTLIKPGSVKYYSHIGDSDSGLERRNTETSGSVKDLS